MARAVEQAYNGESGAELPAGSRGWAFGQGGKVPPEAEAILAFGRSVEAANLPYFLKFRNAKKSDICYICKKNYRWSRNSGGMEQNWPGGCAPQPLPKTATACMGG